MLRACVVSPLGAGVNGHTGQVQTGALAGACAMMAPATAEAGGVQATCVAANASVHFAQTTLAKGALCHL